MQIIEGMLREGVKRKEIRPVDTWQVTTFLWGMMDSLLLLEERQNLAFMNTLFEKVLEQALQIIGQGLANPS